MTLQAHAIARTMTATAAIDALVILVALPSAYFALSYEYAVGALDTQAEVSAQHVTRLVQANPDMWTFEQIRLQELLQRPSSGDVPEARRILDVTGQVVAESGEVLPGPTVARRHPVYDAGVEVAAVEAARSLRPILLGTGLAFLAAAALAALVFAALRLIPLRAIRRAYQSLEESELRYRSLYSAMRDGIALHRVIGEDGSGRTATAVVDVNPACARMFGAEPAELVGKDAAALLGGALVPHLARILEVVRTGEPITFELSPPDRPLTFRVSVFSPQAGHFATLLEDVTERLHEEALRLRLQEQLAQAQKIESIGRLAGGVAHDLNNLLSPILGYTEALLRDAPPGTRRAEDLAEVKGAAERARDLTRQLLAFGRKQVLEVRVLDLREVLSGLEKLLRQTLPEDVRLELRLPPALSRVRADAGQLEQVVMNLAVNGQHAMPRGGVLAVELSDVELDGTLLAERPDMTPGRYVVLGVSDTGHGMEPEVRARLFEPFFTTKRMGEGTGLGLSIVHGIVKQHGGHIAVYSEPGRGTTFRVYLQAVLDPAEPAAPAGGRAAVRGGAETIAVAEDDVAVRRLATRLLERLGYRVLATESAAQCLALLTADHGPVDLLLTDVVMPDMTGVELYDRVSGERPGLKVLFMSGHPGEIVARGGTLERGTHFIQKPFTAAGLAHAVREALDA